MLQILFLSLIEVINKISLWKVFALYPQSKMTWSFRITEIEKKKKKQLRAIPLSYSDNQCVNCKIVNEIRDLLYHT